MKKTFAAITLAVTLLFGSTFSFAGIIISDQADPKAETCSEEKDGIIIFSKDGIIIFGYAIIGTNDTCVDGKGIIISD